MHTQQVIRFRNKTCYYDAKDGLRSISNDSQKVVSKALSVDDKSIISNISLPIPTDIIITNKKSYLYCLNCNKKGHNYRNCRFPVNSYGCVHFKTCSDDHIRYLMLQKRHAHVYPEILKRKYYESNFNFKYLVQLIINMPETDRYYISKYDFDYLWTNYWKWTEKNKTNTNKSVSDDYDDCKFKFNLLKNGHIFAQHGFLSFKTLFTKYKATYLEPDWEFPKGRRDEGETDQQCAIRECKEETRLDFMDYKLFLHVKPFQERYTGINNVQYCNSYYLAELTNYDKSLYYDPNQTEQNNEIRKIGWFTESEIGQLVNASSKYRLKMLNDVSRLVMTMKKNTT